MSNGWANTVVSFSFSQWLQRGLRDVCSTATKIGLRPSRRLLRQISVNISVMCSQSAASQGHDRRLNVEIQQIFYFGNTGSSLISLSIGSYNFCFCQRRWNLVKIFTYVDNFELFRD